MDQGYKNNDLLTTDNPVNLRNLYDKYADKLLGYILPLVNNHNLAEDCVVKIFTKISSSKNSLPANAYSNTWSWLMALAKSEIESLNNAADGCKSIVGDVTYIQSHKYLSRMNDVQRRVFCGVYYHRLSIEELANDLNLQEQVVRQTLKEAFMIIRKVKDED